MPWQLLCEVPFQFMQTDRVYADFVEDPGKFMLEILQSIDVFFLRLFQRIQEEEDRPDGE